MSCVFLLHKQIDFSPKVAEVHDGTISALSPSGIFLGQRVGKILCRQTKTMYENPAEGAEAVLHSQCFQMLAE